MTYINFEVKHCVIMTNQWIKGPVNAHLGLEKTHKASFAKFNIADKLVDVNQGSSVEQTL